MSKILQLSLLLILANNTFAQVNTKNITIARDQYGVPHIYSKTDAEAAYALGFVQCEDNFYDVQESLLAVRGLLASVTGKEGALLDVAFFLTDADEVVKQKYATAFSEEFKPILRAYTAGINRYAELNPKEQRHKKLFPIKEQDVVKAYMLNMLFISNIQYDLARIFENDLDHIKEAPAGSNGIAVSPKRTGNGETYLVVNSHQPLEGFAAWYEVQINTEEGWQIHGATFASGVTPFVGANPDLAWTHCTNYDDFNDVFRLAMHPTEKNKYRFDGEWLDLEERTIKLKVKVGPLRIPVKRTFYRSKYGTVLKNKTGYFALRFPANMVIAAPEQWYHMNKARNLADFKQALDMQQIPSQTVTYADKEGNIFFLNNGLFPKRNPNYDWRKIVPGDTSATLWAKEFIPLKELPQVENPNCGYIFNMNNSGLDCTCPEENLNPKDFATEVGYQLGETARSQRFHALIDKLGMVDYETFKRLKYDSKYQFPLHTRTIGNLDKMLQLDPEQYPEIAPAIYILNRWDGGTEVDNKQAALISVAIKHVLEYMRETQGLETNKEIPILVFVEALALAQRHLMRHFGSLEVELGELQKHVRGDKEIPIWGAPDVITSLYTEPYKRGMFKSFLGEGFILFAVFDENGLLRVETVAPFGSSNNPDSPHYTDQMDMFVNKERKRVVLDKGTVLENAERVYSPE